jgi:carbon starvation protein CstA
MVGLGVALLILGLGSFLLPMLGLQFRLLSIFGEENETIAGIALAVIGAVLIIVGTMQRRRSAPPPPPA